MKGKLSIICRVRSHGWRYDSRGSYSSASTKHTYRSALKFRSQGSSDLVTHRCSNLLRYEEFISGEFSQLESPTGHDSHVLCWWTRRKTFQKLLSRRRCCCSLNLDRQERIFDRNHLLMKTLMTNIIWDIRISDSLWFPLVLWS